MFGSKLIYNLIKKILFTVLVLIGASLVIFLVIHAAPGDPVNMLVDTLHSTPAEITVLRHELGLDSPIFVQYFRWLSRIAVLDFGNSIVIRRGLPVINLLLPALRHTIILTFGALFLSFFLASLIVFLTFSRRHTLLSRLSLSLAYIVSSSPVFLLAYVVIYFLNRAVIRITVAQIITRPEWFPVPHNSFGLIPFSFSVLVLALGNGFLIELIRYLREEFNKALNEDYIRTARAKGASVFKHTCRNVLIPVTTLITSKISYLLGGAVIVETIFNWPGIGRLAWDAATTQDYPIILAVTLLVAFVVQLGSLFNDFIYLINDPRALEERLAEESV